MKAKEWSLLVAGMIAGGLLVLFAMESYKDSRIYVEEPRNEWVQVAPDLLMWIDDRHQVVCYRQAGASAISCVRVPGTYTPGDEDVGEEDG